VKRKTEIQTTMELMDCVAYYRVSTQRQGISGLGLGDQKKAVQAYVKGDKRRKIVASFEEIDSGKNNKRPKIHEAIAYCRQHKARLVIAKLDRMARSVKFIADLMESEVDFYACDLPQANPLTIHIMAAMAEHERKMIAERTRAALRLSKKKLGGERTLKKANKWGKKGEIWNPGSVAHLAVAARRRNVEERNAPLIKTAKALRHDKLTLVEIGAELGKLGHQAPRGGEWHAATVARLLA
jgi:DNA invertase Pin-like site-specific DNA recombinase